MEQNNEAEQMVELIPQSQADSSVAIIIGTGSAQEHQISDVEKNSLLQLLNAKRTGWGRPQLVNGQLWEHYEPTSVEVMVFAIRCGLNQRGHKWDNTVKSGSKVLDMRSPVVDLASYPVRAEDAPTPATAGSAAFQPETSCQSEAVSVSSCCQRPPDRAVLPRPCGPYSLFVYHAVACILYMYGDKYLQESSIDVRGDENAAEQMLTEQYLTQYRDRYLLPDITMIKIMRTLGFIGALGYQCMRVKKLAEMDEIANRVARTFFSELVNPWMAENGGWVRFTHLSSFSHIQLEVALHLMSKFSISLIHFATS